MLVITSGAVDIRLLGDKLSISYVCAEMNFPERHREQTLAVNLFRHREWDKNPTGWVIVGKLNFM
jgi:hypothetical protein